MLNVLDLFSGIGGFSLGLERAGMQTVAFCEIDPICQAVLAKHWPGVPRYDDIRAVTGDRLRADGIRADVVCGGFPCQPFSHASAGKRQGKSDDRYLWPEMLRVVAEVRPAWVCAENVAGIGRLAFDQVVSDLEKIGFEIAPLVIPACAIGSDHRRDRVWFLGYADCNRKPKLPIDAEMARLPERGPDADRARAPHGLPRRMDGHRRAMIGNAIHPSVAEMIGRAIRAAETSFSS